MQNEHCRKCEIPLGMSNPPSYTCWNTCECHTGKEESLGEWEKLWAEFTNHIRTNDEVRGFYRSVLAHQKQELIAEIEEKVKKIHESYSFEAGVDITNLSEEQLAEARGIKTGMESTKEMVLGFIEAIKQR